MAHLPNSEPHHFHDGHTRLNPLRLVRLAGRYSALVKYTWVRSFRRRSAICLVWAGRLHSADFGTLTRFVQISFLNAGRASPLRRTAFMMRNMTISVRSETAHDASTIHSLTEEAFRFAEHTSHTEQFITDALRRAGQLTISLVAIDQDEIVGHVAISPVTLSDGTVGWYGLGPVAVSPSRQRRGIGAVLIDSALTALRRQEAKGCVVLGEPSYYGRFGFREHPSLVLPGVPVRYFQALVFAGPVPCAQVRYHSAFDS